MLNLKEVYGKRYRIKMDESYAVETSPGKTAEIAWYYEIDGRNGQIYNRSDTHLQLWIKPRIGLRLYRALPSGWEVVQAASDGYAFSLPNAEIGLAFKWVKPRKRRLVDPAQADRLKSYRFGNAARSAKTGI